VQRLLCGYCRKKCKKDSRVYPEPIKRGFGIRPNDTTPNYLLGFADNNDGFADEALGLL
jgi:hypothetical protein